MWLLWKTWLRNLNHNLVLSYHLTGQTCKWIDLGVVVSKPYEVSSLRFIELQIISRSFSVRSL